jgi:hypothetical protein
MNDKNIETSGVMETPAAPARAHNAGDGAVGAGPAGRFSAQRKLAAVQRLLRGEAPAALRLDLLSLPQSLHPTSFKTLGSRHPCTKTHGREGRFQPQLLRPLVTDPRWILLGARSTSAPDPLCRQGLLPYPLPVRAQCIIEGVGQCTARPHHTALRHALHATGRQLVRAVHRNDLDRRQIAGTGHRVIHERAGKHLPVRPIGAAFHQRARQAHANRAMDLPGDDGWIDLDAAIMRHDVAQDAQSSRARLDLDPSST